MATACGRHGVDAVAGSFLDDDLGLGAFDLVVLSHVLEHVADLGGAASALSRLVAPDGMVYVEVPDAAHYCDHLVAPFHDFNTEHINHFSLTLLDALLVRHGFTVDLREDTVYCWAT